MVRRPLPTPLSMAWNYSWQTNLSHLSVAAFQLRMCLQILLSRWFWIGGTKLRARSVPAVPRIILLILSSPLSYVLEQNNHGYQYNLERGLILSRRSAIDQIYMGIMRKADLCRIQILGQRSSVVCRMMEVILNSQEWYPYGQIKDTSRNRVSVRRIVTFSTPSEHQNVKAKIEILKSLRSDSIVKLTKVLQDEGAFHLMYQYVPFKLRYQRYEQQDQVKQQLEQLSEELQLRHVEVRLEHINLGVNSYNEIRYYLDIQHIAFARSGGHSLKQLHLKQIHRVLECLAREPSSARTEPMMEFDKETYEYQLATGSRTGTIESVGNRRLTNYKSLTNLNIVTDNPLETLQQIQDKLQQLRSVTKKYTPAMRESFKSKEHLRETVKEHWKAEKIDNRKMSGHTIYVSMFMGKGQTPEKKQQKQPHQHYTTPSKRAQERGQITPTSPPSMSTVKAVNQEPPRPPKEPLSKRDFVEIQKNEFQSYYRSKETYVHEFLNVLSGDDSLTMEPAPLKQHSQPTQYAQSYREKCNTIYDKGESDGMSPSKLNSLLTRNKTSLKPGDIKAGNRSAQLATKFEEKTNELKERMTKALRSRDEVQKTRKNSVQTQIGVRR